MENQGERENDRDIERGAGEIEKSVSEIELAAKS